MAKYFAFKTDQEIAGELASRVSQERVRQNITQQRLSELSGVTYASIRHFERTGKIGLERLISLLRALKKLDELAQFLAPEPVSPMQRLNGAAPKTRKRARSVESHGG
jgi:transcriptional regulator with XRE-family HTH domain